METKDEFIIENMPLVGYTVNKFIRVYPGDDLEEIYQVGYLGLIKAYNSFNKNKGVWSNYAIHCIRNEILMHKRKTNKYNNQLYLDETVVGEDGETTHGYFIADKFDIEDEINAKSILIAMKDVYENMQESKSKRIIHYYMNFGGKQGDIAKIFNTTQPQISKMIRKYKNKVKAVLNED